MVLEAYTIGFVSFIQLAWYVPTHCLSAPWVNGLLYTSETWILCMVLESRTKNCSKHCSLGWCATDWHTWHHISMRSAREWKDKPAELGVVWGCSVGRINPNHQQPEPGEGHKSTKSKGQGDCLIPHACTVKSLAQVKILEHTLLSSFHYVRKQL